MSASEICDTSAISNVCDISDTDQHTTRITSGKAKTVGIPDIVTKINDENITVVINCDNGLPNTKLHANDQSHVDCFIKDVGCPLGQNPENQDKQIQLIPDDCQFHHINNVSNVSCTQRGIKELVISKFADDAESKTSDSHLNPQGQVLQLREIDCGNIKEAEFGNRADEQQLAKEPVNKKCETSQMVYHTPQDSIPNEMLTILPETSAKPEGLSSNLEEMQHSDNTPITPDHPDNSSACLLPRTIPDKYLDDVLSELKFGIFQIKMILLAGGGYFAVCSEILVFVFLSKPIKKEWDLPELQFPWLPFFSGIGGIVGGYVFGILSDKCGRQIPFMVAMGVCATFGLASAFAPSFLPLVVIRSFVSVGTGGLEAVDFVLLLEFLPKRNRGTVMVMVTFCGALGAVYAGGMAWLLLPRSAWGWRWFVGACALPSILMFVVRVFVSHETPRYLFISGQPEKAVSVLNIIAKHNGTKLTEGKIICPEVKKRGRILELFSPTLRWRTTFICLVWLFQSTGYWGVTLYLPEYMDSVGVDPYFNMFTIFLGEIPGLCLAMILIESHMLGRIKSLRFFSFFTAVALLAFSFVPLDFLKAVFVLVCYFFMVPIYAILNAFTPEIYPTNVRSTAMALVNVLIEIPGLVTPFAGEVLLSVKSIVWLYPVVWSTCFGLQFLCTFGLRNETAGEDLVDRRVDNDQSTNTSS